METTYRASRQGSTKQNNSIQEMGLRILGQQTEEFTIQQISSWFNEAPTPEFNYSLFQCLRFESANPSKDLGYNFASIVLLQLISKPRDKTYVLAVALSLRFGASPNLYIQEKSELPTHILGYIFKKANSNSDKFALNDIVSLLVLKGARSTDPIFDKNSGKIRKETEISSDNVSVLEWLEGQGYKTILSKINISNLRESYDDKSLTYLAILLDRIDFLPEELTGNDMNECVRKLTLSCVDKCPVSDRISGIDNVNLIVALNTLHADAFTDLLNRGMTPSYLMINEILSRMSVYRTKNYLLPFGSLREMMLNSIDIGIVLDKNQADMVSILGEEFKNEVEQRYQVPYWKKICKSTNEEVPENLKSLAFSLNIDSSLGRKAVCSNLDNIVSSDTKALKEANITRQQTKMSSELSSPKDYISGTPPELTCSNAALLNNNPFEYTDNNVAYYKDQQNKIWCFPSENFEYLLEKKVNPNTQVRLPDSFIEQVKYKSDILKKNGINVKRGEFNNFKTYSQAIDDLQTADKISENSGRESLDQFIVLAENNNVSMKLVNKLTTERMIAAFNYIGYRVNLSGLDTQHALITTSHIINKLQKMKSVLVGRFFSFLRGNI